MTAHDSCVGVAEAANAIKNQHETLLRDHDLTRVRAAAFRAKLAEPRAAKAFAAVLIADAEVFAGLAKLAAERAAGKAG